jgi:D-lactate dehydrogenase
MHVAVFSTKAYDQAFLEAANESHGHVLHFLKPALSWETAALARGFPAVCLFVNDQADHATLETLKKQGTCLLALRCAGFNQIDLKAAQGCGITVLRVPAYSPHAVAEHTVGLLLTLSRKIHRAYNRTREGNFSLEGLLGFNLQGQTVGIVGTGQIGTSVARILQGFGCHILAYDPVINPSCEQLGVRYVSLDELFATAKIITLHTPLTPETHHLINRHTLVQMRWGVILINTSRGALVDSRAVIEGLKSGKIGALGLDVYEEEGDLFFEDLSNRVLQDDVLARLMTFPNVVITGHQAFFTQQAMETLAQTTLQNITAFEKGLPCENQITWDRVAP